MAKLLGSRLPSEAMALFGASGPEEVEGKGLVIVTLDEAGLPHPSMASFAEIFAPDPDHLWVLLWPQTSAARNLRERRKLAFCAVDNGVAYYVKGDAADYGDGSGQLRNQRLFWVTLSEVYEDREPAVELTGISYRATVAQFAIMWRHLFEAVRKLPADPGQLGAMLDQR